MLVDTHAHLQMDDYDNDRDAVIARATDAGVIRVINVGFDLLSSEQAVTLAEEHEDLYAAVGVHPHDAESVDNRSLDALRDLAGHPKVVAIGETGLDYYRDLSPRPAQKSAFAEQLRLAAELDLPVIVHNREAHADALEMLGQYSGRVRGVMHCFSGDRDFADNCVQMGLYISFAGPITYPKSHQLLEAAAHVQWNRFLVETDCPYLAPQFRRGKRNEPSYVKAVAKEIAQIRHTTFPEIARITSANANALFGIGNE